MSKSFVNMLLLLNAASTWALFGLIWTIQLVHYPLMRRVGAEVFPAYHAAHALAITPLVGVLMLVEGVTAVALVLNPPAGVARPLLWVALLLVVAHVAATALVSVPLHQRLAAGYDAALLDRLVATNWIRTAAWSARGVLMFMALRGALRGA